jgi:FixJ family two-component response regulator
METPLVCVVDDDDAVRLSISLLVETLGLPVRNFPSAIDMLADPEAIEHAHCVVLDVRMPGLSGVGLQERLIRLGSAIPIIFVSAHGDVPMVARAMREGAFDFLQKPFNEQHLLDRVQEAVQVAARRRNERGQAGGCPEPARLPHRPGARCDGRDGRRAAQQADRR